MMPEKTPEGTLSSKSSLTLHWPDFWLNPGKVDNFLKDLPVVGLNRRVYKEICNQLQQRNQEQFERCWADKAHLWKYRDFVLKVVQKYFDWPCSFFYPQDPCEIIFWVPNNDLITAETLGVISSEFSLPSNFWDDFPRFVFSELLNRIEKLHTGQ